MPFHFTAKNMIRILAMVQKCVNQNQMANVLALFKLRNVSTFSLQLGNVQKWFKTKRTKVYKFYLYPFL